jgi:hypothetical protein
MRKIGLILLIIALLASPLYAKELATVKGEDGVTVKVSLMTDPPVIGSNNIRIDLADTEGNAVTDAKINLYYSMAPMKGMAPMNKKVRPKLEGDSYTAAMKIGMKGHWDVTLKIKRNNANPLIVRTKFMIK